MTYVNQEDVLLAKARGYLAQATCQLDNWPFCGSALARSLEHAACAVFMAWGEPYKAVRKMHRHFDERLARLIDPAMPPVVQWVWEYEGGGKPDQVAQLLAACEHVVDAFADLAKSDPPAGWQPLPIPPPVGWEGLAETERSFLRSALGAARQGCPNVRLMLFGSRAAGTALPNSDYDVLFIFPDDVPEGEYGQSVGRVVSLANEQGVEFDDAKVSESQWLDPAEVSRPFIDRIKTCHVEIPDQ